MEFDKTLLVEMAQIREYFDLEKIIAFTLEHQVEIPRSSDMQYHCVIDGKTYSEELTFLWALVYGVDKYLLINSKE